MDTSRAGKKIRVYFGAITESGVERKKFILEMKDLKKWMEKLDCEEKDSCDIIENTILKGRTAVVNLKFPIFAAWLEAAVQ